MHRTYLSGVFMLPVSLLASITLAAINQYDCDGTPSGSIIEKGRYYYQCNNGMMDPKGCLSDKRERVAIGQSFRLNDYQMICSLQNDGYLSVDYAGCVIQGNVVRPGETVLVQDSWLSCIKQGNYVVQELSGCVVQGRKLQKNEKLLEGGYVQECRETASGVTMTTTGCVSLDGSQYRIGDTYKEAEFIYSCTWESGQARKKIIGCLNDGREIQADELFAVGDVLYRCDVTEEGAQQSLVGCVKRDGAVIQKKTIGCHWIEGPSPQRFTVSCDVANGSTVKNRINCVWEGDGGQHVIEPTCYRVINNRGIGCKQSPSGLEHIQFEPSRLDIAHNNGLQVC